MAEFNKNVEKVNIEEVNIKNVVGAEQPTKDDIISRQILDILNKLDEIHKNCKDENANLLKIILSNYNELLELIKNNQKRIESNEAMLVQLNNSFVALQNYVSENFSIIVDTVNNLESDITKLTNMHNSDVVNLTNKITNNTNAINDINKRFVVSSSEPTTKVNNLIWFNTSDLLIRVYINGVWQLFSAVYK